MMHESKMRIQNPEARNQKPEYSNQMFLFYILYPVFCILLFAGCASDASKKGDAEIHYKIGIVHLNEGNIPEAMKELTAAVEKYHNDATFHNALGLAYFWKGLHEDAIKHFKEAIRVNPKFSDAHTNLAAVYLEKKEWDLAIAEAKLALADVFYTTPEFAYFNMGRAFYEKADYVKAEESYKKTLETNPRYWLAYNNLGLTYMKMNRDKEAADILERTVKNTPNYIDANYNLGLVLIKLKNKQGAINAFQEVIRIAPDSEMATSAKGYIDLLK